MRMRNWRPTVENYGSESKRRRNQREIFKIDNYFFNTSYVNIKDELGFYDENQGFAFCVRITTKIKLFFLAGNFCNLCARILVVKEHSPLRS